MSGEDSVTAWIAQVKNGDPHAAHRIWSRYVKRLVDRAKMKLRGSITRVADEDDVASLAFTKFVSHAGKGGFTQLAHRDDLWAILATLIDHEAIDHHRKYSALKRGNGLVRGDSVLEHIGNSCPAADTSIAPDASVISAEEIACLFLMLDSEELEQIALERMEGWTNAEIAEKRGMTVRSVERKVAVIRKIWQKELSS